MIASVENMAILQALDKRNRARHPYRFQARLVPIAKL
jgi:hypothetical protein